MRVKEPGLALVLVIAAAAHGGFNSLLVAPVIHPFPTYCRHIVRARDLAGDIAKFKRFPAEVRLTTDGIQRYDMLLRMADRERAAMVNLATKMRLTQQSRYRADKAAPAVDRGKTVRKPTQLAAENSRA
jgi:hypothetical protein